MPNPIHVELLGKPGCHLCDDAREVVVAVLGEFADAGISLAETNILEDAALAERYREEILPVIKSQYTGQDFDYIYQVLLEANQYKTTHNFNKKDQL